MKDSTTGAIFSKEEAGSDATLSILAPVTRSSVVDAVADRIRGEILAGRLVAGARLPSERELSLALGVNRLTLRAALARLEALGLIITRHGAGTVVASWRERAGLDALVSLAMALTPADAAWHELLAHLLEVRRVLAAEAVALAAERHTPEQLRALEQLAEDQKARIHDPVALARGDVAFQRAVVRAAGNIGLELILNTFARIPDEHPEIIAALYQHPEVTLAHYPAIIGLIRARDAKTARHLIRETLEHADFVMLENERTKAGLAISKPKAKKKKKG